MSAEIVILPVVRIERHDLVDVVAPTAAGARLFNAAAPLPARRPPRTRPILLVSDKRDPRDQLRQIYGR